MRITVIGSGYVGLVTGACFAEMGNSVVCVDNDREKITELRAGRLPIYEPGLDALVNDNAALGRLQFTADIGRAIRGARVIFIAVGTPPDEDGSADLRHIIAVAESIGQHLGAPDDDTMDNKAGDNFGKEDADADGDAYCVIAAKSTVPVGTSQKIRDTIAAALVRRGVDAAFGVVSNPEFLKQGAAVDDFMKPDRIIIGARERRAIDIMRALYAPFNRSRARVIVTDIASAELTKYAANAMLAAKISCLNEIANLAGRLGADIEAVRLGVGADPRIGYAFIYPGCGYGGSCFPKDVRALCRTAADVGYSARILEAVETVNHAQQAKPLEKLVQHFGEDLSAMRIAVWGLAFKPDTDDMRDAPSRVVLEGLWARGAAVHAFDPAAGAQANQIYGTRDDLTIYADDPYCALSDVDALIVLTEWRVLRAADPVRIKAAMRGEVLIDGRNLYDPAAIRAAGLIYYGIGRR